KKTYITNYYLDYVRDFYWTIFCPVIYLVIRDQIGHVVAIMNDLCYLEKIDENGKVGVGEIGNIALIFGAIDVGTFDVYQTSLKKHYERWQYFLMNPKN